MKKVAIFTEGQTELIFLRTILPLILGYENVDIACKRCVRDIFIDFKKHNYKNLSAKIGFLLINAGNDERALSAIKEQESGLFKIGFDEIFCLRDVYSKEYLKLSQKIDIGAIEKIKNKKIKIINGMSHPEKISLYFAIMEFEAWFLAFYKIFERIDNKLTLDYIKDELEMDLAIIDPEKEFLRPFKKIEKILDSIGVKYDKSEDVIEKIVNKIEKSDMEEAIGSGKISCFKDFYEGINRISVCG